MYLLGALRIKCFGYVNYEYTIVAQAIKLLGVDDYDRKYTTKF